MPCELDSRHRWVISKIEASYEFDKSKDLASKFVERPENLDILNDFFTANGPEKIVVYQNQEIQSPETASEDAFTLSTTGGIELYAHSLYFIRASHQGVSEDTVGEDIITGEIAAQPLDGFKTLLSNVYIPLVQNGWCSHQKDNKLVDHFVSEAEKFVHTIIDSANGQASGIELAKPKASYVENFQPGQQSLEKIARNSDLVSHCEEILFEMCSQIETFLQEAKSNQATPIMSFREVNDASPETELEFWRTRLAKFNSINEQLQSKECTFVVGVNLAAKTNVYQKWRVIDTQITDASNEAKDNLKYLTTLEKSMEPMYSGTPQSIIDALPALLNNIKMMHSIARYYNTPERMTTLFVKVTNQMIKNCKQHVLRKGKLWDQDIPTLVQSLSLAIRLNDMYQEQYKMTKESLASQPKSKQLEIDEVKTFGKFDLFCRRASKLVDLFTTIEQFSSLAGHTHIEGLESMNKKFTTIVRLFRGKPYDFLDYTKNQFDRDYLEFNNAISELESSLQAFVNKSFENITSTEKALNLLRQFQAVLQRESLKSDLDDKYLVIFQNYGLDLESIQKRYEKWKSSPPVMRNTPPVSGAIMWARNLFRRMEEPMQKFSTNKSVMATKEAKKIIRTYNRVAKALVEFEMLWFNAWVKSVESSKAGLQATLIIRHPSTKRLVVNFDKAILQLIRESKILQRLGLDVPESARMVALQEEKFKFYFNQLTHALEEYDRIIDSIPNVLKPLLAANIDDLDRKIRPGMQTLTWNSMNIDGFLQRMHNGTTKLEDLVRRVRDIINNRIESKLKQVSKSILIELDNNKSFSYEEFISTQNKYIKNQSDQIAVWNVEIERAIDDLSILIKSFPRENDSVSTPEAAFQHFKLHYSKLIYRAILNATKNSFNALKQRLRSRNQGGAAAAANLPLFHVNVELSVPAVSLNPSLDDIQRAINTTAKQIICCSQSMKVWGCSDVEDETFYDLIAQDNEIVKVVILLTGSVEGAKNQVMEYIKSFSKYDFLWKLDMHEEYEKFMKTSPTLENFEAELKKYMALENEISTITPTYNIECLLLEIQPLKYSLKAEAASWKTQFARKLHLQGLEDLKGVMNYIRDTTMKLNRKTEDLEDVRAVMQILKEVREREAETDAVLGPIEEMYALLTRYEVRVPKEEIDAVSDLRYSWKKLRKLVMDVNDKLIKLQSGFKKDLLREIKAFSVDIKSFRQDFDKNGPMVPGIAPLEAVDRLKHFQNLFNVKKHKFTNLSSGEELFGLPVTEYGEMEQTEKELALLDRLYGLYTKVLSTIQGYSNKLWVEIQGQMESIVDQVEEFQNECRLLPRSLHDWEAYQVCKKTISEFQQVLPILQAMSVKSLCQRHWQKIMTITGKQLVFGEDLMKLKHLLECNLLDNAAEIEEICEASTKEESLEAKLNTISEDWSDLPLTFANYKSRGPVILKAGDTFEIIEKLEESQLALAAMATNRYAAPFREEVQGWIVKLSTVGEVIEMWLTVQNMWMYMEAVFTGGDIAKQLPQEAKRFNQIDKIYIKIMASANESKNVIATCYGNEMMKNMLPHLTEQLNLCQKSLSSYLETKRALFPRFYFVSDPTLLEILSMGSDPQAVTQHFQSGLFDSMADVTFDKKNVKKILKMHSRQDEVVDLTTPFVAEGSIETWLQNLVQAMQDTMKAVSKEALFEKADYGVEDLVRNLPAQVALLSLQFQWTSHVEEALRGIKTDKTIMSRALKRFDQLMRELVQLTAKDDLSSNERTSLESLITVHVHQRDAFNELLMRKIKDVSDFEWLRQCRFYWKDDTDVVLISIADVDFIYAYEYLGIKEQLVITPLTDRCYVTLSQALGMYMGGAPAGPAGTGKTETTKQMGGALGKYVVVFNCSDQMDFRGMGKIYKGLAQSGLWGCFDEFNRINLDVLSVCAQQLFTILSALRERKSEFTFTDGQTVSLNPGCGYFITMNPGYAGRQELPENLKSLFRGITMMVPNREIIIRVKLASCGYFENDILAKKFNMLYFLCQEVLSKQPHYDFGLRNILSVLRTAGANKRANPELPEAYLMMITLKDMNLSKFVAEDVALFTSLVYDIFIEQAKSSIQAANQNEQIEGAIRKHAEQSNFQITDIWMEKCIQLYELHKVRHGIMLVGPPSTGKTGCTDVLAASLSEIAVKHVVQRMNPKAITAPQMFGRLDAATNDWQDGVFSSLWRKAAKTKQHNTWIVLDGPVDAVWIENLNTVLDDNKVLTLANGDRILMTPQMKAFFEAENLNNASPATVSRVGILFMSETVLHPNSLVTSWLQTCRPSDKETFEDLFNNYFEKTLEFFQTETKQVMPIPDVCTTQSLLTLLDGSMHDWVQNNEALSKEFLEKTFLYCLAWSFGGLLDEGNRVKLHAHIAGMASAAPNDGEGTIFDYFVDKQNETWAHWNTVVPEWKPGVGSIIVPTMDSARYICILNTIKSGKGSTLLIGDTGTGKSTLLSGFLEQSKGDTVSTKSLTFSSLTTPLIFQTSFEAMLEKRQGRTFGPPGGKQMILLIDDISMPKINEWGDQPTNELSRQIVSSRQFYNLEKPGEVKLVVDVNFVAAMKAPGPGKNDIPNRLKRQFCIFLINEPTSQVVDSIYGIQLDHHFSKGFAPSVSELARTLVKPTISLWKFAQSKLLPTPSKLHYLFNMRELSRTFQGVLAASKDRYDKSVSDKEDAGRASGQPPQLLSLSLTMRADEEGDASNQIESSNIDHLQPSASGISQTHVYLLALWQHEIQRIFCDKLIEVEEKQMVQKRILEEVKTSFGQEAFDYLTRVNSKPYHFLSFLRDHTEGSPVAEVEELLNLKYEGMADMNLVRGLVYKLQSEFNQTPAARYSKLDLVLFDQALAHLMHICRALTLERSSMMLVGVGGSGKRSLSRIAAYLTQAEYLTLKVTRSYTVSDFLEDLKNLFKACGLKNKRIAFCLTDQDIREENFLEYLNQLLMTGEVSGLFPGDEKDVLINDFRSAMKGNLPTGFIDTPENLYQLFIDRVSRNLHVLLCVSPTSEQFAQRALQFPGLINGCIIDWFLPWTVEALSSVADRHMDDFEWGESLSAADGTQVEEDPNDMTPGALGWKNKTLKAVVEHMSSIHSEVRVICDQYFDRFRRRVYVTPKSFLTYIASFIKLYKVKHMEVIQLAGRIVEGLKKMLKAQEDVKKLKEELAVKKIDLEKAKKNSEALLADISVKTSYAEKEKVKVMTVKNAVEERAREISQVKAEAESDLAAAKPALEEAESALNSITSADIQTLKKLQRPPEIVTRIFDTVLLLKIMPVKATAYEEVKGQMVLSTNYPESIRMMSDARFLQSLLDFAKESINDETVELLQPYYRNPDFNFDVAKKASGNVAGLCNWSKAMCQYHEVAKVVEPKIMALKEAEGSLGKVMGELNEAESKVAAVQSELDAMQANFDRAMVEKQELEDDAQKTENKMTAANSLISALADEQIRWTEQSEEFKEDLIRLIGNCTIGASFLNYSGPFNKEYRDLLYRSLFVDGCKKRNIIITKDLDVQSLIVGESEVGHWILKGLPNDEASIQGGILVMKSSKYPLLIDPQGQGVKWLRSLESQPGDDSGLKVTAYSDKHFRNSLEECLSFGRPILLENVGEDTLTMDSYLDPLLEQQFIKSGRGCKVTLGDKDIDCELAGFKFYITTRLPNPAFSPELFARVTVIDFTVTMAGLEDQLLATLVLKEKSELEEQRKAINEEVTRYKQKIEQLEDDILYRLSTSKGNLLDDTALIDALAATKQIAKDVKEKLANANLTQKRIAEAREEYRPVAARGAISYFLVSEFSSVNCMYHTSLAQFADVYDRSIDNSERAAMPAKRISNIVDYLTRELHDYVSRGLFEEHKLTFSLLLAIKILQQEGRVDPRALNTFCKGGKALDITQVRKKPKDWIPDAVWLDVTAMADVQTFVDLVDAVCRNDALWKAWYDNESPEEARVPEYEDKVNKFERLMLIKTFRPDRTLAAAADVVDNTLGSVFLERPSINWEQVWKESDTKLPIICILAKGSDPTKAIEDLAKTKKVNVLGVSMGQGQEIIARKYLTKAMQSGDWVLLQNTHLGLSYLSEVENLLESETLVTHANFRLWLTAEPHPKFPIGLLHRGVKVVTSPPSGLKASFKASFNTVSDDVWDTIKVDWRQVIVATCFLHSLVQERRKYGPIGWNVPYEFNTSDLTACLHFISNHLLAMEGKRSNQPAWATVQYMIAEIQYGGRITDDYDRLLMISYAENYYSSQTLDKSFELFKGYAVPSTSGIPNMRSHIEKMTSTDAENPEVFGLHKNADITYRTLQAESLINTIVDTQPKQNADAGGGDGKTLTREDEVDKICEDLIPKIPARFKPGEILEKIKKLPGGAQAPLSIHLRQETDRLNITLKVTMETLRNLRFAIAGTIALTEQLSQTLDDLYNARIPAKWVKVSWEASSLGSWFTGLIARHDQLMKWAFVGRPKAYWLTGFFNPQGFLNAVRQEVARKHSNENWALDDVVLTSTVTHPPKEYETLKDTPNEGVYVYGLFLEGAAWNGKDNSLVDSEPKKIFSPLPILHISAAYEKRANEVGHGPAKNPTIYKCPAYRNKKRTGLNFVAEFDLRTDTHPRKWTQRGVALLCTTD